jgi:hypothetical protein
MQLKSILSVIMTVMLLGVFLRASTYPTFENADCKFEAPAGVAMYLFPKTAASWMAQGYACMLPSSNPGMQIRLPTPWWF